MKILFMLFVIMQVTLHAGILSAIAKIVKLKPTKELGKVVSLTKTHKTIKTTRSTGVVTFRKERTTPFVGRVKLKKADLNQRMLLKKTGKKRAKVIIMNNRVPKPRLSPKEKESLNIRGKEILDQLSRDRNFKDWLAPQKNRKTRKSKKSKKNKKNKR